MTASDFVTIRQIDWDDARADISINDYIWLVKVVKLGDLTFAHDGVEDSLL